MKHAIEETIGAPAIDRNLVRKLLVEHYHHIALLTALRGDVQQSRADHADMVNSYMTLLSDSDRRCFASLYEQEMNLQGTTCQISVRP